MAQAGASATKAGCIDGLIPTLDQDEPLAVQNARIQEQRRLLYVAITRAREVLILSSAIRLTSTAAYTMRARVRGRGATVETLASQFLDELGQNAPQPKRGISWARGGYM